MTSSIWVTEESPLQVKREEQLIEKVPWKKRYFRNLWRETKAERNNLDFGKEGWFDLWHTHLDFTGLGIIV